MTDAGQVFSNPDRFSIESAYDGHMPGGPQPVPRLAVVRESASRSRRMPAERVVVPRQALVAAAPASIAVPTTSDRLRASLAGSRPPVAPRAVPLSDRAPAKRDTADDAAAVALEHPASAGPVMTTRERIEHRARALEQAQPVPHGPTADVVDIAPRRERRRSPDGAIPERGAEPPDARTIRLAPSAAARGPPADAASDNQLRLVDATTPTGSAAILDAARAASGAAGRRPSPVDAISAATADATSTDPLVAPSNADADASPAAALPTPGDADPVPVVAAPVGVPAPTASDLRPSSSGARQPVALRTAAPADSTAAVKGGAAHSAVAVAPERAATPGPVMTREQIERRTRAPEQAEPVQRASEADVVDLSLLRERRQAPDAAKPAPGTRATEHAVQDGARGPPADPSSGGRLGVPDAQTAATSATHAMLAAPGAVGRGAPRTDAIPVPVVDAPPTPLLDTAHHGPIAVPVVDAPPTPGLDTAHHAPIPAPAVHATAVTAPSVAGRRPSPEESVSGPPAAGDVEVVSGPHAGIAPAASAKGVAVVPEIAAPADDSAPAATPKTVRYGSHGVDVARAQDRLDAHGAEPPVAVDGIFGPLTRTATTSYQRSHGLDADGIIGPRTWTSLMGPTVVGSGQVRGGASVPPSGVLRYDTGTHNIPLPPAGADVAHFLPEIKAKQDLRPHPDLGPTVHVTGVTPGSEEEIFLYNVLVEMGKQSQWGREADLQTEIGRPSTANNGRAPKGQVTVRIDAAGNATVALVGRGEVGMPAAFATRQAASEALMGTFGFALVMDDSATWTVAELNIVHAALLRLPTADRVALNGLDLVRVSMISRDGEQLDGLFTSDPDTGKASLSIADGAFTGDALGFIGAGGAGAASAASMQTIAHEAAHAVETKALRDAQVKTKSEERRLQESADKRGAAVVAFNAAELTARAKALAYSNILSQQARTYIRAHDAATDAINLLVGNTIDTDAVVGRLDAAAIAATVKAERALGALATAQPKHPAPVDFKDADKLQREWRLSARSTADMRVLLAKQRARERAVTGVGRGSRRLALFVAFVNAKNIPRLTDYAARTWDAGHPEEFFAEAYSLWLNDRQYLQGSALLLVKWFDDGNYLK